VEATACSRTIIANTSARAISASLVAVASHHIGAGGALDQRAVRSPSSQVANASYVLVGIPWGVVRSASLGGELLLGEADTIVTALVGADGSLASNALVVREASALASLSVASTLVRALNNGVDVVCVINISDPGLVLGAGAARAIRAGPLLLSVDSVVALALVVGSAAAVARAAVGAVCGDSRDEAEKGNQEVHFK